MSFVRETFVLLILLFLEFELEYDVHFFVQILCLLI
jgi:hypothetical protein